MTDPTCQTCKDYDAFYRRAKSDEERAKIDVMKQWHLALVHGPKVEPKKVSAR